MRRGVLLLAGLACLLLPGAAGAGLRVSGVDSSEYPRISLTVVTPKPTSKPPTLLENGKPVADMTASSLASGKSVVLAIDRSQSMRGRPLAEAVSAALAFVRAKPASDRIAVTTFATQVIPPTDFSASTIDAAAALRAIVDVDAKPGTRLYDDVVASAQTLQRESQAARVIILVTDGNESLSNASLGDAIGAARAARAAVYVVAIESRLFTPGPLQKLASATGGAYYFAQSPDSLAGVYQHISDELSRTWHIEYLTALRPGEKLDLGVAVPGQGSASRSATISGSVSAGQKSKLPAPVFSTTGTIVFGLVIGLLVMIAVRLVFRTSRAEQMTRRILPHLGQEASRKQVQRKRSRGTLFQVLFSATEHVLGRTKQWSALGRLLQRGDVPLKTVEFVYIILGSGLVFGFLVSLAGLHGVVLVIVFAVGGLIPVGYVWRRGRRRLAAFDEQLPDLLMSVAASLKAGHSFKQGIQTIVEEAEDPARKEFHRVLAETSLGRPIEEAMADMAERLGSSNFSFIVTAVTIQNQVGGSLAGLFDMVADTVRQRQSFARKIKALTAMGRASAYVLIALPFFLAGVMTLINHKYMGPLFTTSTGQKLIGTGLVMMAIGSTILRKIVSFKG
jgi:tight adherence protein B